MTHTSSLQILSRLEAGFRANSEQLHALKDELTTAVLRGQKLGEMHDAGPALHGKWDEIGGTLGSIQRLATTVDQAPQGRHDQKDIEKGLETSEALEAECKKLMAALVECRALVAPLDPAAREEWNLLAQGFEEGMESLQTCVDIMRIRLELQEGRSPEEVDRFVRDVLAELREKSIPEEVDASTYQLEYLKAAIEISHEKHESLGFPRVIKTLFTWYENPEERVRRKLFLPMD